MEIRARLYPYPVLSSFSNDYESGVFNVAIDSRLDGYNLRIDFMATLTNENLFSYIKSGKASFVYHLECSQTGYRTVIKTQDISKQFLISSKNVTGRLQISPFIVAMENIKAYSNSDFHKDYQGTSFDIETGCVMATGNTVVIDIPKDIDELVKMSSIFTVAKDADKNHKEMLVDLSADNILIKLPENDFNIAKQLDKTFTGQTITRSLIVLPALVYVLEELKGWSKEEHRENLSLIWYEVLSRVLLKKFDCDIESDDYEQINLIELAQKLINDPISDALQELIDFKNFEDDE